MKPGFERAWRQRFAERGRRFDNEADIAGWSRSGLDARYRRFLGLWAGDRAGERWLDAGCGAGTYTRHLRACGVDALGLDYSAPSLLRARNHTGGGCWVVADVKRLPLAPGSVDGVLCFGVLQALATPAPALREIVATVRPGGEVWVDGLNRWCLPNLLRELRRWLLRRPPHLRYDDPLAVRRALRAAGATAIRLYWLPLAPERHARLRRWLEHPRLLALLQRCLPVGLLLSHSFIFVARAPGATTREDPWR